MNRNLGKLAGQVLQLVESYRTGHDASYTIDYGEWSSAASQRALERDLNKLAQEHGYKNFNYLEAEISRRANPRWVYFHFATGYDNDCVEEE